MLISIVFLSALYIFSSIMIPTYAPLSQNEISDNKSLQILSLSVTSVSYENLNTYYTIDILKTALSAQPSTTHTVTDYDSKDILYPTMTACGAIIVGVIIYRRRRYSRQR